MSARNCGGSLEVTQSVDEDSLLDAPLLPPHALHAWLRPKFYAIPTVCLVNILLLIHVAFVILAFLAGMFCYPDASKARCPEYYTDPLKVQTAVIIAKVILWLLHLFLEQYIQYHHSKAKRRGYFLIYRNTRYLKRLPLLIQSTGNAALLLILSVQYSFPEHNKLYLCFILAVLSVELICSLICQVVYTVKVSNFNRAKPRPDIIEEEKTYAYPNRVTSEVGFRETSVLEEVVEKQGDVIEYLQRHSALLSKKLLALTSQQGRS
ncbi:transmembrane protein 192 isoform X2 [Eublepharis macularius]|uniref:Transmembrane protein 192 n=1 Tax=Eublepharis macularius TaxID=481883 RepID=A0AA97JZQ8_EUBMA|nr:transmembrane protein 192 isoform X2 [Eublepharis macularius]